MAGSADAVSFSYAVGGPSGFGPTATLSVVGGRRTPGGTGAATGAGGFCGPGYKSEDHVAYFVLFVFRHSMSGVR